MDSLLFCPLPSHPFPLPLETTASEFSLYHCSQLKKLSAYIQDLIWFCVYKNVRRWYYTIPSLYNIIYTVDYIKLLSHLTRTSFLNVILWDLTMLIQMNLFPFRCHTGIQLNICIHFPIDGYFWKFRFLLLSCSSESWRYRLPEHMWELNSRHSLQKQKYRVARSQPLMFY